MTRAALPVTLLAAGVLVLGASGCVSKKDFVAKSAQADRLAADLGKERQRNAELSLRAATLEGQLAEVQRQLAAAVEERDRLRGELNAARIEGARLAGQLAEASDQRDTLARQLEIVQRATSQKDVNLQKLTYQYDDLIKNLEAQKGQLSRKVADLESRLKGSEGRVQALTNERDALQGERLRLDVRNRELSAELASAKKALGETRQELTTIEQQLAAARNEYASTAAALDAARADLGQTQAQLAERERLLQETTATYDQLVADLKGEISEGQVKITRLRDRLTVNLVDRILFDSGSTAIKPRGQEVLRKVAEVLKGFTDKRVQIEGHTDNVPIAPGLRSRFPTNWELSVARATVVARFLQDQAGLDPSRLVATGFGEHHPVASNDAPEGRAQNRRIEIVLVPDVTETALK